MDKYYAATGKLWDVGYSTKKKKKTTVKEKKNKKK
jgi:hypothetical protein